MTAKKQKAGRRLALVRRALQGYESLPPSEQVELLIGAAEALPAGSREADEARATAFAVQVAEGKQLSFARLLALTPDVARKD